MELFDCETGEKIFGTYVSIESAIVKGCSKYFWENKQNNNFKLYLNWDTYITKIKEAFDGGFPDSEIDAVYPVTLFQEKSKNCPLEKLRKKQTTLVSGGILKSSTSVKSGYIPEKLLKEKFKKTFSILKEMNSLEGKLFS